METWVRGSVRRPLGAASAWLTTAPSFTAADGRFSRNPRPGAQEGVSSISTFNTPRTVIGLVGPRGAHAEVGPRTQLGEAHDFFWGRRGQKESRRGLGSLASFVQTRLVLGASLGGGASSWSPLGIPQQAVVLAQASTMGLLLKYPDSSPISRQKKQKPGSRSAPFVFMVLF